MVGKRHPIMTLHPFGGLQNDKDVNDVIEYFKTYR
jgi:cytochrome c2